MYEILGIILALCIIWEIAKYRARYHIKIGYVIDKYIIDENGSTIYGSAQVTHCPVKYMLYLKKGENRGVVHVHKSVYYKYKVGEYYG